MNSSESIKKVYIRHAEKAYNNGKSRQFKHDPPLTENGRKLCKEKVIDLIQKSGLPSKIICSPYRRCRETAEQLYSELLSLDQTFGEVPIIVDPNLSEYLGNRIGEELDVLPETKKFNVPHPENWSNFLKRIQDHSTSLENVKETIWIVTHGIVLRTVSQFNNLPGKKNYAYLESVII